MVHEDEFGQAGYAAQDDRPYNRSRPVYVLIYIHRFYSIKHLTDNISTNQKGREIICLYLTKIKSCYFAEKFY